MPLRFTLIALSSTLFVKLCNSSSYLHSLMRGTKPTYLESDVFPFKHTSCKCTPNSLFWNFFELLLQEANHLKIVAVLMTIVFLVILLITLVLLKRVVIAVAVIKVRESPKYTFSSSVCAKDVNCRTCIHNFDESDQDIKIIIYIYGFESLLCTLFYVKEKIRIYAYAT